MQKLRLFTILMILPILALTTFDSAFASGDEIITNVETRPILDGVEIPRVEYVDPDETVQASSSNSGATFTFTGDGWGHRVGMSQYGALGMAKEGKSYEQILKHYYTGINLRQDANSSVKVILNPEQTFTLTPNGDFKLLNEEDGLEVSFKGSIEFSQNSSKEAVAKIDNTMLTSTKGFTLIPKKQQDSNYTTVSKVRHGSSNVTADYRGSFYIEPDDQRLTLINELDIEDYLRGVVPSEMPASWGTEHLEALKAQAVAARTYAKRIANGRYLDDDVSNQVYRGKSLEHTNSDKAIKETQGVVAVHNDRLIDAVFHSSSGGHTENSENVWGGKFDYLKAVDDRYDTNTSHHHGWSVTVANETIAHAVFGTTDYMVSDIKITKRTDAQSVQEVVVTAKHKTSEKEVKETLPKPNPQGQKLPDRLRAQLGFSLNSIKFDVERNDIFTDVTNTTSGYDEVMFLYDRGVISGFSDNSFKPNQTINRIQTARMIDRELNLTAPPSSYQLKATDVSTDRDYYELFRKMEYHRIMTGNNGKMNPGEDLKRSQMAIVLTRTFNLTKPSNTSYQYADINRSTYSETSLEAIDIIAYHGITTEYGKGKSFRPNEPTSRVMFSRFMTRAIDESFR
ncbi:SpoIID/LytB domain-containing protein [Halalkalibacter lacteus]|uniref:SpoIID/LytB domain-containing protein n=1 Tax=Halalkalibacter lacteus TaxID=3090663 RepID=UPI002FCA27BE